LKLGLQLHVVNASAANDFEPVFAEIARTGWGCAGDQPKRTFHCASGATCQILGQLQNSCDLLGDGSLPPPAA
jgi:hypothetical protein